MHFLTLTLQIIHTLLMNAGVLTWESIFCEVRLASTWRFDALFTSQGCCNKLTLSGLDVRHGCTKITVSVKVFIWETLRKKLNFFVASVLAAYILCLCPTSEFKAKASQWLVESLSCCLNSATDSSAPFVPVPTSTMLGNLFGSVCCLTASVLLVI